jgi:hypothetical protein
MVARLQQGIVFGWLLLATSWLFGWWSRAPVVAFAGLGALVFAHAAVLAIEFIASYRVSVGDARRRASAWQFVRAWAAESCIAPRVFCWAQPFRSHAVSDQTAPSERRGAVLVHGFMCNRGFWNPWLGALRADGRAFVAVDLEPVLGSIDAYVQTIDEAIVRVSTATGQAPMLICHSMGGLAARAWLRDFDGARISRIVTIGTPHAGTWLARFGRTANGRQMRPGGDWLQKIEGERASTREVAFTCWYSNCDNIVFPVSAATLPGADNRLAAGRGHVEMAFDPVVQRETLALLDDSTADSDTAR